MEKTDLNLTCTAQAIPAITAYTWYKTSGGRAETVGQGPVLSLSDLSKDHTGEYLCATRNEIGGGNSSSVSVRVKYGPKHTEVIHNLTRWPIKGQAVALSCQSQSYPPIDRYTWYLVTGTAREKLVSSSQNLTIDPDKQGTYYCNAKNAVSSSSSPLVDIVFEARARVVTQCTVPWQCLQTRSRDHHPGTAKETEEEERDYENVKGRRDAEVSADWDEAYSVISFTPCPRLRRRHDDDTSSDEDDPKTQYSDVKI
ncbi:hypothetical protein JZ751_004760 [Albula glossodonta]|uniref:Ig-like domain-containing protein n=1 Tax=Albula glossodonta TaxID=121402 RepID=A0A8T2NCE2_9TELE|nr:hypothetical protein JZ751_004760 [Albula glossodonta]